MESCQKYRAERVWPVMNMGMEMEMEMEMAKEEKVRSTERISGMIWVDRYMSKQYKKMVVME